MRYPQQPKQQTSCTLSSLRDSFAYYSAGVYTPRLDGDKWERLAARLSEEGLTADEYLYYYLHHSVPQWNPARLKFHNLILNERTWSDFLMYFALSDARIGGIVQAQTHAFHVRCSIGIPITRLLCGREISLSAPVRVDLARALYATDRMPKETLDQVEALCGDRVTYVLRGNHYWLNHCKFLTDADAQTGRPSNE